LGETKRFSKPADHHQAQGLREPLGGLENPSINSTHKDDRSLASPLAKQAKQFDPVDTGHQQVEKN